MTARVGGRWLFTVLATLAALGTAPAAPAGSPAIAIIIDDLGDRKSAGRRAVNLPGPVAVAVLPHTPFGARQAERAHALGKEVLLHLPLQPGPRARAHPTSITLRTDRTAMDDYVASALESVPHVSGVNNHQGSLLTETPLHMEWLMAELRERGGLYFVDSRTSAGSIAYRVARARGIPAAERSVFLDDDPSEDAVRVQFQRLVHRAIKDERALGIGHPNPTTLKVLEEELPRLAAHGVRLVSPSELIALQSGNSPNYKQLRFSPSLTLSPRKPGRRTPGSSSAAVH